MLQAFKGELYSTQGCYPPPPVESHHAATSHQRGDSCKPQLYFNEACLSLGRHSLPNLRRCERDVHFAISSNSNAKAWPSLCCIANCRHPSFVATFDNTNEVDTQDTHHCCDASSACICLSFVISCDHVRATTKNGSSLLPIKLIINQQRAITNMTPKSRRATPGS